MFRTSAFIAHQAAREVAVDVEVHPEDSEYQEVTACVQDATAHRARIRKVLRHQIPHSLYCGGKGCRESWSVLADADGATMHFTIYNRERTAPATRLSPKLTSHGFYLRCQRRVANDAHH